MPRQLVLSPTRIRTFQQCAAKYRLEYIDRLGRFYRRPRAGFSFGTSLHSALEIFHEKGGPQSVTPEALTQTLQEKWLSQGYDSPEQEEAYRLEAERILLAWHESARIAAEAAPPDTPPAKLLFSEKTLRMDLTEHLALSGRVDRIDEHHDGALEILDYKSGRESVTSEDVQQALAMGIYQTLLKRHFPERRVFATLIALRTGLAASHEQTPEESEALLEECRQVGETLLTRDWTNVLPVFNDHCDDCDFRPHCERYWRRFGRPDGG